MAEVTLSSKNQIVIPREAREALKVKPGDKLVVCVKGDKLLIIEKPKSYAAAFQGVGIQYPADYLTKERESWD